MKTNYFYLILLSVIPSVFFIMFSCSDDSYDNNNESNDTFFSLSPTDQQAHWLNPQGFCSVGWNIHPYKKCSRQSFGVKSYNEIRSKACGVEEEKHECKSCRHYSFGVESTKTIKKDTIIKKFPNITIDIFAPHKNDTLFKKKVESSYNRGSQSTTYTTKIGSRNLNLSYSATLPDINNYCSSQIPKIVEELKKQYPNYIVLLNFMVGHLKLPNDRILENYMLEEFRDQRTRPLIGLPECLAKDKINNINRNLTFYPSCHYILELQEPTYKEVQNCEICGSIDEILYKLCRDPSHGVEEYNTLKSKECGVDENTLTRSDINLTKQQIEQTEGIPQKCQTCDDITFDSSNMNDESNQNAVSEKVNCLKNNLNELSLEDENLRFYITRELERLKPYSNVE